MSNNPQELTIHAPDDWHLHLRDGAVMQSVLPATANQFERALIMPNLVPPVVTSANARAYKKRIVDSLPPESRFLPLMTLYLTETTDPEDVAKAHGEGLIVAVKLYPAGATTNSDSGVTDVTKVDAVLEKMAKIGLPLCVHGEVTDSDVDIFDREAVFIETVLDPLRKRHPGLRVVMEHVTTEEGVAYVKSENEDLAATLTTHHLMINRNDLFKGGIRPHYYCLPIAKREKHRLALRAAAVSGDKRFFLGTDSAPHTDDTKESACGCAGVFNAPNTLSCLAEVFEQEDALDNLEAFVSINGATYYGLPVNERQIKLSRQNAPIEFQSSYTSAAGSITVFDPGCELHWRVVPT